MFVDLRGIERLTRGIFKNRLLRRSFLVVILFGRPEGLIENRVVRRRKEEMGA